MAGCASMNRSDERGFTLLEVLVALVIFMVGIGAFYQAFGSGLLAEAAAQRQQRSAEVAANLLAGLGRSQMLQDGVTNGELPEGYRWTLRLEPFTPIDPNGQSPTIEGHLATLDVQEVGRAEGGLRVQTLLLGVAPQ
jgi:prepilin-type N-terminal cleavage/methylation domain-containing protein